MKKKKLCVLPILLLFLLSVVPVSATHPDAEAQTIWGESAAGSCTGIVKQGQTTTINTPLGEFSIAVEEISAAEETVQLSVNGESFSMSSHGKEQLADGREFYTFGINENRFKIGFDCQGAGVPREDPRANELVYCRSQPESPSGVEYIQTIREKCGLAGGEILTEAEYRQGIAGNKALLREMYEQKKQAYTDARQQYLASKQRLQELREAAQQCKNAADNAGNGCTAENQALATGIQQHLFAVIELTELSLEKLELRVESSETLRGGQKEELFREIRKLKEQVEDQRELVQSVGSGKSGSAALRKVMKELKEVWKERGELQRKIVALLVKNKLEKTVEAVDLKLGKSIDARIQDLQKKGAAVDELKEVQEEYDTKVAALKEAQEQWEQEKNKETLRELQQKMKQVKETLREFNDKYTQLKQDVSGEDENAPGQQQE